MNDTNDRTPAASCPAGSSPTQTSRPWAEVRREMAAADRARLKEFMENDPVLQAAAQRQMEREQAERAAARAAAKALPAERARMSYELNVGSGFRPLELVSPDAWPEPKGFGPPPLPVFKTDWLGGAVGDFAAALTENLQVPGDMTCLSIIGATSTAILGRMEICPRQGWNEPAHANTATSLQASEKKSQVQGRTFRPIRAHEARVNVARMPEVARSRTRRRVLERASEKAISQGNADEADRLAAELAGLEDVQPVTLLASDVTPEALVQLASANHGCIALVSAEGGVLRTAAFGRYSDSANLDPLLQGYSGEAVAIHRVGRPPLRIERLNACMTLAVQPDVLRELFSNREAVQRGLCARFIYAIPEPMSGRRRIDTPDVPPTLEAAYDNAISEILAVPRGDKPRVVGLTPEAARVFHDWREELESRRSDDLRPLEAWGWGGKADGLTLRIAANLAVLENPRASELNASQLRRAVAVMRWAIPHALTASASLPSASGGESAAQALLEALRRSGKAVISTRDAHRLIQAKRSLFPNADAVRAALRALADRGFVKLGAYPEREGGAGRPPEPLWIVSPRLNETPPAPEATSADEVVIL